MITYSNKIYVRKNSGFSLADFVVGSFIIVFLVIVSTTFLISLSKGSTANDNSRRALAKLASAEATINVQAASFFMDMSANNEDVTGPFDRHIQVLRTIGPIDPATRTRSCLLTAIWNEGSQEKRKIREFKVSQTRLQEGVSNIKLRVVKDEDPTIGVDGVLVTATGAAEGTTIFGYTDNEGVVLLNGAKVSETGISVTVNAGSIRGYFNIGGTLSYTKTVQTGRTKPLDIEDSLYKAPIRVSSPGEIFGYVTDIVSGAKIKDAKVKIFIKGTPPLSLTLSPEESVAYTNEEGEYRFKKLLPCNYSIYFYGNNNYAGYAKVDDLNNSSANASYATISVLSNQATRRDYRAIMKGSAHATTYLVDWNGTSFVTVGPGPENQRFKLYRRLFDTDNLAYVYAWDWRGTRVWADDFNSVEILGTGKNFGCKLISAAGPGGILDFEYTGPGIVNAYDYDVEDDFVYAEYRTDAATEDSSYLPALMVGPTSQPDGSWDMQNSRAVVMKWRFSDFDSGFAYGLMSWGGTAAFPPVVGYNDTIPSLRFQLFPNGLDNPNATSLQTNAQLYVLKSSVLSNIVGNIYLDNSSNNYPDAGTVSVWRQDNTSYGGFTGMPNTDLNRYYKFDPNFIVFDNNYSRNSSVAGAGGANTFSMAGQLPRAIMPTFGGDLIKLKYVSNKIETINKPFSGSIVVKRKISETDYETLDSSDVDFDSLRLSFWRSGSGGPDAYYNVVVQDGAFSQIYPARKVATKAETELFTLPPASTITKDIFINSSQPPEMLGYSLRALDYPASTYPYRYWPTPPYPYGVAFPYNSVTDQYEGAAPIYLEMQSLVSIHGNVVDDVTNEKLSGVYVQLRMPYSGEWRNMGYTAADVGNGEQYSIQNLAVFTNNSNGAMPTDIAVEFIMNGYSKARFEIAHPYNGLNYKGDVRLRPTDTGGGGGGGGGGL